MTLNESVRRMLKSSFRLSSGYYLASECATRVSRSAGYIRSRSGSAHHQRPIERSVEYIHRVFADYKRYGRIDAFHGRVAEIGPGDNCGVGLLFLLDGCEAADLVDRFYTHRSALAQAQIYRALLDMHPGLGRRLEHADLRDEESFPGIRRWYGPSAAAEEFFRARSGYDFIVSRAVFEHLYDPILALERMQASLKPGGYLLHKIDLRDHGMYSEAFHELKFLEIPDWLYPWLTRSSGRPNRVLVHRYREQLQRAGLDFELLVTRLVGIGDIEPHAPYADIPRHLRDASLRHVAQHRGRFAASLREVSDEDLCIAGVFLVARRPAQRLE